LHAVTFLIVLARELNNNGIGNLSKLDNLKVEWITSGFSFGIFIWKPIHVVQCTVSGSNKPKLANKQTSCSLSYNAKVKDKRGCVGGFAHKSG
jgi:hypothetical protein